MVALIPAFEVYITNIVNGHLVPSLALHPAASSFEARSYTQRDACVQSLQKYSKSKDTATSFATSIDTNG
jgi:hypothetical protein